MRARVIYSFMLDAHVLHIQNYSTVLESTMQNTLYGAAYCTELFQTQKSQTHLLKYFKTKKMTADPCKERNLSCKLHE